MKAAHKTIVVTGAGSGMGREIALLLLKKGARVIAVDRNQNALNETLQLAGESGVNFTPRTLDITDKAAVESFAKSIISQFGGVDGLINNAGIIQPFVKVNALQDTDIERVMNVNFFATVHMTRAFLPHFLERPEAHIVNISSMGGFLPVPGQTIYGASKAAVKLFTEGLHSELRNTNVRVTIIFPGSVATNITANSGVQMKMTKELEEQSKKMKPLTAVKAAEQIIKAMEENAFRACVGRDSVFLDILYRFYPRFAAGFIANKMDFLLK